MIKLNIFDRVCTRTRVFDIAHQHSDTEPPGPSKEALFKIINFQQHDNNHIKTSNLPEASGKQPENLKKKL